MSTAGNRRRIVAAVLIAAIVAAGLAVHLVLPDSAATDIAGDALYAGAAYALVVLLAPRWAALGAGGLALAWCVGVELFQLTGLPGLWASGFPPIVLALGTVFDARDLAVYALTIAGITILDLVISARSRRRSYERVQPPRAG